MKKFFLATLIALMGLAQQAMAVNATNNTNCSVDVTALLYNVSTCGTTLVCTTVTIPAHSTVTFSTCVPSSTTELIGYSICWADAVCATIACATIGNSTGPYPCAAYPAGPVYLPTCGLCSGTASKVKISWSSTGSLIIG
ncbi:MAG TPA: hypothetical protein VN721_05045 [Flavipsychrobacter sp.]|nr:hypothetical protein [Flavipsychrobacter sp.]